MKNENGMHLKILVVDDDKKLRSVLKSLLTEDNHEITTCHDGLDAIQKCREQKFDLVITDLMMPGASGLKVLKETRVTHPETLVILITGFVLFLFSVLHSEGGTWSLGVAVEIVFLAVATALAYVFWDIAMRKGDVTLVVSCSYLTPFLSTVVSCIYLGVLPGISLWVGCALIISGSYVSWRSIIPKE